jgi:hypothetical protein
VDLGDDRATAAVRGASVRSIDPADNRGAGSATGNALEDWCEEQPFRIRFVP